MTIGEGRNMSVINFLFNDILILFEAFEAFVQLCFPFYKAMLIGKIYFSRC